MNKYLSISLMVFLLLSCSKTSKFEGDWFNEFGKKELIITKDGSKYIVKRYLPLRNEEIFIGTQDKDGLTINDGNQIKLYLLEDKLIYDGKQLTKNFTETDFFKNFSKEWFNTSSKSEYHKKANFKFDENGNLHLLDEGFMTKWGIYTHFNDSIINYDDIRFGNESFTIDNLIVNNGEVGDFSVVYYCYIGGGSVKQLHIQISSNGRSIFLENYR